MQIEKVLSVIVCMLAVLMLGLSFYFAPINSDAGTYLSVAQKSAAGEVFHRDIKVFYTPIALYLFSGVARVGGSGVEYEDYLLFILLIHMINAGGVYALSGFISQNLWVRFIAAVASLILALTYEGEFINLEPFCVLFAWISIYAGLRGESHNAWNGLAGLAVALCFLSKQYGLAAGFPLAFLLVHSLFTKPVRDGIIRIAWATAGFVLPFIIFLGYHERVIGNSSWAIISEWFASSDYGNHQFWPAAIAWMRNNLISIPILILLPVVIHRKWQNLKVWVFLSAWLVFAIPFYLQTFQHYFLLSLPFGILLGVYIWETASNDLRLRKWGVLLCLIMAGSMGLRTYWQCSNLIQIAESRQRQYALADKLAEYLPAQSQVLILPSHVQWLNYVCRFQPVDPKETGYEFPSNFSSEKLDHLLKSGMPIVTDTQHMCSKPWQTVLLKQNGYELLHQVSYLEIWEKQ